MKNLSMIIVLAAAFGSGVSWAQQSVGPSAAWCKDRTLHHEPGRYRIITVQTGDARNPQKCVEVLDTKQSPVCRVRFDCDKAT